MANGRVIKLHSTAFTVAPLNMLVLPTKHSLSRGRLLPNAECSQRAVEKLQAKLGQSLRSLRSLRSLQRFGKELFGDICQV